MTADRLEHPDADGFEPELDAELDAHMDAELDAELEAELEAGDLLYREVLTDLFRVPTGLVDRTRVEVEQALLGRSTMLAGVDLLGTGWRAARLLFGPSPQAPVHAPDSSAPNSSASRSFPAAPTSKEEFP